MTPATDDELMACVRTGDQRAFAELYERHRRAVFSFLRHLTGARETAEDLLQEAFLRAWRRREDYQPSDRFLGWLFTIARHLAIDWFRRRGLPWEEGLRSSPEVLAAPDRPDRRAEARDELARLQNALDRLPPVQREVVLLSRFAGLGSEEIARIIGSTPGAVRVQLHRALSRLRAVMEP